MGGLTCSKCGADVNRLYFTDEGGFCRECFHAPRDVHVYTGRKNWAGIDVWGEKKLKSDAFRADLEEAFQNRRKHVSLMGV